VPDLTRPGHVCGMTAQHAERQGKQVARNVAATLGKGKAEPYKHADLGFLVDLDGLADAANPRHVPLSGPAANAITRGYHLSARSGNRMRVLTDWILNGLAGDRGYTGLSVHPVTRFSSRVGVVSGCLRPGRARSGLASGVG
jgi:NADH dehydrogenase